MPGGGATVDATVGANVEKVALWRGAPKCELCCVADAEDAGD